MMRLLRLTDAKEASGRGYAAGGFHNWIKEARGLAGARSVYRGFSPGAGLPNMFRLQGVPGAGRGRGRTFTMPLNAADLSDTPGDHVGMTGSWIVE